MQFFGLFVLCAPMSWLLAMVAMSVIPRTRRWARRNEPRSARAFRVGVPGSHAVGAAFLFLASLYRPSLEFIAKAQIQEVEKQDEDEDSEPAASRRHFLRQLRRIRRGERVDRLVLKLE